MPLPLPVPVANAATQPRRPTFRVVPVTLCVLAQYAPSSQPVAAVYQPDAVATTADVSAAVFAGVSEADQIAAIRKLYEVVNPDKMAQVR